MAKRAKPPNEPYYTPNWLMSQAAWKVPDQPTAQYPNPINPPDEPEPGSSATADPNDPNAGGPSSPQLPGQPQLTSSPPPTQLPAPQDQPPLAGRTWASVNAGLQSAQQPAGQAGQSAAPQQPEQPQARTWDSVNAGLQSAQQEQPSSDQPPSDQPPAQLPDDEFKQKVAAATNVESKGGPPATELQANVRRLSEWKPGEKQTGATQRDGNYWFSEGSHALSPDLAKSLNLPAQPNHAKLAFIKNGQVVGYGYYDDKSYFTEGHPTSMTVEKWGHGDQGNYDSVQVVGGDDRPPEAGTKAYHDAAVAKLGADPAAGPSGGESGQSGAGKTGAQTGGTIKSTGEEEDDSSTYKPEEAAAQEAAQPAAAQEAQAAGQKAQQQPAQDLEENITSPMLTPPGGMMSPLQGAIQASVQPLKKKKPEDEEDQGEEDQGGQQPDAVAQALAQYQAATTQTAKKAALQTLKQAHLDSLSDDDTRVQHDPVTGKFKGTHFMGNDPVHQDALSTMPEDQQAKLAVGQEAIQGNQLMHASYGSAPASAAVIPSKGSREEEYAQAPAGQRTMEEAQIAGHTFMPVNIGVTHAQQKGAGNKGYIEGMSASFIAQNANHLNHALQGDSPYPDITDPKFGDDFEGYVANLNNGWTGNGQSRVKGTNAVPIQVNEDYQPHLLTDQEANYMNAIMHNIAAKNKGGESKQRALDLAAANGREVGSDGETNPFRAMVDNRQMRRAWYPGQAEPPSRPWSDEMLSSAFKTFHANLIHQLHDHPGQMAESIRPPEGVDRIAQALRRRGVPHKDLVAANVVGGPVGKGEGKPGGKPGGPGQMQLPLQGESQNKQIYWVHVDELEQHLKKKGRKKKT